MKVTDLSALVLALSKILGANSDNAGGELSTDSVKACADAMKGFAGRARDSDPALECEETLRGKQEAARGDTKRASDAHVIHSIDRIFSGEGGDNSQGLDAIFHKPASAVLARG